MNTDPQEEPDTKGGASENGGAFLVFVVAGCTGEDNDAVARIEEYMESRNYVPLEDSEQMRLVLNMAHSEVAALAERYVKMINSVFPRDIGVPEVVLGEDEQEAV